MRSEKDGIGLLAKLELPNKINTKTKVQGK